eukprot:gnl/MRDRNA2_/MRDRNA2_118832_c0_seq1.p1 gnl/MRDRNA2_/MRDRNA2_118832_c0~~gnl/MRDRNA2_/MRDRNA2_118832_c0_seq1.p1  ORF type:complete len:378 (-),score=65.78 gnl/MRDRNA2_/MRDRNA2_118832_c0_seq1:8-1141(-)
MAQIPIKLILWASFFVHSSCAFAGSGPFDALVAFNKVFPPPQAASTAPDSEAAPEEKPNSAATEAQRVAFSKVFPIPQAVSTAPHSEAASGDRADSTAPEARKPRVLWDAPGPVEGNTEAAAVERDAAKFLASVPSPSPLDAPASDTRTGGDVQQDASRFLASVPSAPLLGAPAPSTQSSDPRSLDFQLRDPAAVPQLAPEAPSENLISGGSGLPEEESRNCLDTRPSKIKGAGQGLFSTCEISSGVRLGEYRGERRMSPSFNHAYEWSVPICSKSHFMVRGASDWAACGAIGKEYIDGASDVVDNPLRFVNGANSDEQRQSINVFPVFYDGKVFYITSRDVHVGEEFIIDYGEKYWKAHNSLDQYWKVVHRGRLSA